MIIQQVARTQAYPYKTQKADSAGAWQAPKTLKHGLQRQYDKELVTNIYVQDNNLHWEQTSKRVFKFQVALLAWKMWEEQPTAILLSSSRRREILLLIKFGRMA